MTSKIISWSIWNLTIRGVDFYHLISLFIIFSVLGWLWESSFVSIKNHQFINRGFVTGPVCTIYGAGAVSVYMILRPFEGNNILIFFMGMLVATVLEYITSFVMEKLFHAKWWDYSNKKWNLHGRICLGASVGWGVFSLALFWFLMPFAQWFMSLYPEIAGRIGIVVSGVVYLIDFVFASTAAFDLSEKLQEMETAFGELQDRLKATRFYEELDNAKDELEKQKEVLAKFQVRNLLEETRRKLLTKQSHASRRILRAYPSLHRNVPKAEELQEVLDNFRDILRKKLDDK